jgi:hypothetical protein
MSRNRVGARVDTATGICEKLLMPCDWRKRQGIETPKKPFDLAIVVSIVLKVATIQLN